MSILVYTAIGFALLGALIIALAIASDYRYRSTRKGLPYLGLIGEDIHDGWQDDDTVILDESIEWEDKVELP